MPKRLTFWIHVMILISFPFIGEANNPVSVNPISCEYLGPDTIYVGSICTAPLLWNEPNNPVCMANNPGGVIISRNLHSISGGYSFGDDVPAGTDVEVVYRVTDNMGNVYFFEFVISFVDTIAPVFDSSTLPADTAVMNSGEYPPADVSATDNCDLNGDSLIIEFEDSPLPNGCVDGSWTRTYTVTDPFGNQTHYTQHITQIPDTLPPVFVVPPQDTSVMCTDLPNAFELWLAAQYNNMEVFNAGGGEINIEDNAPQSSFFEDYCGVLEIEFTATDSCGNFSTVLVEFEVFDPSPPSVDKEAEPLFLNCDDADAKTILEEWLSSNGYAEFSDACGLDTIFMSPAPGDSNFVCNDLIQIKWIAQDICGQTSESSVVLLIADEEPPVLHIPPSDRIVDCFKSDLGEVFLNWLTDAGGADFSDSCTPDEFLSVSYLLDGNPTDETELWDLFIAGFQTPCTDEVMLDGQLVDNVLSHIEVEFVFSDLCGNSLSHTAIFAAVDQQAPIVTQIPENLILDCTDDQVMLDQIEIWYNNFGGFEADDDCSDVVYGANLTLSEFWDNFLQSRDTLCGNTGSAEVLFFAEDLCGNRRSAPQVSSVFVVDTVAPVVIAPPSDLIVNCSVSKDSLIQQWIVNLGGAELSDNCGDIVPLTFEYSSNEGDEGTGQVIGGPYPSFFLTACNEFWEVTFVVADECGNTASFGAMVFVEDSVPPDFSGTPDSVFYNCNEDIDLAEVIVDDLCSSFELSFEDDLVADSTLGCGDFEQLILRTYTAEDVCGNTATFDQWVIVGDFEAPQFSIPQDTSAACDLADNPDITGHPFDLMDNCFSADDLTIEFTDIETGEVCSRFLERTWTITDPCGNAAVGTQIIIILDTIGPEVITSPVDLVLECGDPLNQSLLENWLESYGDLTAAGGCADFEIIPAVSGSWEILPDGSLDFMEPLLPESLECTDITDSIVGNAMVDFILIDECGNFTVATAEIRLLDTQAPEIFNCHDAYTVVLNEGDCSGLFLQPGLVFFDACSNESFSEEKTDSVFLSSVDSTNPSVVVDTVVLIFSDVYAPFSSIQSVSLEIELIGVDGEQPTEFFMVYDEKGNYLGDTELTDEQCGNSLTTFNLQDAEHLNSLAEDGQISFTLIPFFTDTLPGSFFINDICDPGLVSGKLQLEYLSSPDLDVQFGINYEPLQSWTDFPESGVELTAGNHVFQVVVEDCSANRTECYTEIFIQSVDFPSVFCAADTFGFADEECLFTLLAPMVDYEHLCNASGKTFYSHPADDFGWLSFSLHPDFNLYQMDDYELEIEVNGPASGGEVFLYLNFLADVDTVENWIQLVLPSGEILGNTKNDFDELLREGNCDQSGLVRFRLEDSLFNSLIQNDVFSVSLRQNPNIPFVQGSMDAGINPCNLPDGFSGGLDEKSYVRAYVVYHPVDLRIEVSNDSHFEVFQLTLGEPMPELSMPSGNNELKYIVTDPWGSRDSCSVEVVVADTINPVAICKNSLIEIRPSITDSIAVTPDLVDGGSFDNCSIADFSFTPEYISCTDAGLDKTVMMVVTDHSGNKDSCTALLKVEMISLEPQFSLDLCNPDTLFLFADFPEEGSAFSYQWSGPANFSSTQANPIIAGADPLNSGIYHVTVTGFGGCQAIGSVNVNISPIATPAIEAAANVVCEGDEILLSSTSFSGPITYNWYQGVPPSGVLLGTTSQPGFSVNLPVGTHRFYVVAENPDCSSNPSASVTVEVVEEPVAVIDPSLIRVCENSPLALSSPLGPSFTYQWTGPAGFVSDLANPIVTNSANASNAGNYFLVVGLGTCISDPVGAEVIVEPTPVQPIVHGDNLICVGDSLNLRVPNITTAHLFTWKLPDGSELFTSINQLTISNANTDLSGEWQVTVAIGNCNSEVSEPFSVLVEEQPVAEIITNSPVCQGDSVLLIGSGLATGQYNWAGPGGFSFSGDSIFQPLPSGNYHLTLTSIAGCAATASVSVVNKIVPEIQAIVQQGFDCVDGSSDYCLQAVISPSNEPGMQYNWSGPMNFSSNQATACIPNISEENNGIYSLTVSLDGCESEESDVEVEVTDIGFTPQIAANALTLCDGDSLLLSTNISPGPGVRFNWITPLGPILTTEPQLKVSNLTPAESGVYSLFVSIESCSTGLSQELNVVVNPRPATPVVSGGGSYCAGDSIVINAEGPDGTLFFWMGPVDLQQGNATQVLWPATSAMNGQYSVTALREGCTSLTPATTTVVVRPLPNAPPTDLSINRICLDGDRIPIELCIPGDSLVGGARISYFLNNELEESILTTFSLCATWEDYDLLEEGSNSIRARIQVDGCWSDLGAPVDLRADKAPGVSAFAGASFLTCESDMVIVSAGIPEPATGQWSSPDFDLMIEDKDIPLTEVSGLKAGENRLIWSLSSGICRNFDRDTLIINYLANPIANNLNVPIEGGEFTVVDPLLNDIFGSEVSFELLSTTGNIEVAVAEGDLVEIQTSERWYGTAEITYAICLLDCPEKCSEAKIIVVVGDVNDCEVPNIFTPNRDGINDSFIIPCLSGDQYPNNRVSVYDQWGSEVFTASPYQNDWEGIYNGRDLPEGTYFYVIEFGAGKSPVSGFVVIKR